jgi:hypothetical protein
MSGVISMMTKEYKNSIRKKIHGELRKEKPNMRAVRDMFAMIEDSNKDGLIEEEKAEKKKKFEKPKGKDSKMYIDIGLTVEKYIEHRLDGMTDEKIAKLYNSSKPKIARLRKDWGLKHIYKVGSITEQQYVRARKNGHTLTQICEAYRLDRSSLYHMRKKWGRLGDMYNYSKAERTGRRYPWRRKGEIGE